MPRRISRYRNLAEVMTSDAQGRKQRSQMLRTGVTVTSDAEHILQATDRLDHLANRYYQEPRMWWRICDANPGFLSPLALLGSEPIVTVRLPLLEANPDRFNDLLARLRAINGVEAVQLEDSSQIVPEKPREAGQSITLQVEQSEWSLTITFNQLTLDSDTLTGTIVAAGFTPASPQLVTRLGKPISIPPDVIG